MTDNVRPTWGYHSDGRAEIFNLEGKDDLPKGWHDTPQPAKAPAKAATKAAPKAASDEPADEPSEGSDDDAEQGSEQGAEPDAVKARGIAAAKAGKPRNVPPAYRGKDAEARWLEGYDSEL